MNQIYLPKFSGINQSSLERRQNCYKNAIFFTRKPFFLGTGFEGQFLMLGLRHRTGIVLAYCPSASLSCKKWSWGGVGCPHISTSMLGLTCLNQLRTSWSCLTTLGICRTRTLHLVLPIKQFGIGSVLVTVIPLSRTAHFLVVWTSKGRWHFPKDLGNLRNF